MGRQGLNPFQIQTKIDRLLSESESVKRQYKTEKKALQKAKQHLENVTKARTIAQEIAENVQRSAHKQLSGVVTACLKMVFGNDYSFDIEFLKKRGRTEAKLLLLKNKHRIENPLDEDSGGVLDIAGFALRLACLVLSKPKLRKILILDEPMKNLHSPIYRQNVREMIERLSKDFKVQIIMVTGIPDFELGKVIQL